MWMTILSFIGGPVISGLINAYREKLKAGNVSEKIASDSAAQEQVTQQVEIQQQTAYRIAELGYWYEPDKLMGYFVAILLGKIIVWDICLGLGTTTLHDGWMTTTANLIVSFYFGKRGFENIAHILKRK